MDFGHLSVRVKAVMPHLVAQRVSDKVCLLVAATTTVHKGELVLGHRGMVSNHAQLQKPLLEGLLPLPEEVDRFDLGCVRLEIDHELA